MVLSARQCMCRFSFVGRGDNPGNHTKVLRKEHARLIPVVNLEIMRLRDCLMSGNQTSDIKSGRRKPLGSVISDCFLSVAPFRWLIADPTPS